MTYAAMGWPYGGGVAPLTGFGAMFGTAGTCSCTLCAANTQARCTGGQMSSTCPDNCCGVSTFNNTTYKKLKGAVSWRRKNERRVRHVLHAMLAPVGIDPTGLESFAYNNCSPGMDCGVDQAFLARVQRAAYNYHTIYPYSRWYKKEKGFPTPCASDGWYSIFKEKKFPATNESIAALQNAVGSTISSAYKAKLLKVGFEANFPGAPPNVETWWRRSHKTIDSVPGSQGKRQNTVLPDDDEFMWYGGPDDLFVGATPNGVSPWMQKFLADFAPRIRLTAGIAASMKSHLSIIGGGKKGQVSLAPSNMSALQMSTLRPLLTPQDEGAAEDMTPAEAKKKKKMYVALGLGAVVVLGVGVWASRRRRR